MHLAQVSVNKNSASEVARLYFKWRNSQDEENNDKDSEDGSMSSRNSAISVTNQEVLVSTNMNYYSYPGNSLILRIPNALPGKSLKIIGGLY